MNEFLENEKLALEDKLIKARDGSNENTYKNLIQAYERVLELIRKENVWTEKSSHYFDGEPKDGKNEYIATWKQKGEDIKDHKIYKVEKEVTLKIKIELSKDYIIDGDDLTIPMKINGRDGYSIKGKKVDNKWVFKNGHTVKCE